jgi:hypothetical protein
MTDWIAMIRAGDAATLASLASRVVGFPLPAAGFLAECVRALCDRSRPDIPLGSLSDGRPDWGEATWEMWIRNRADPFRPPPGMHAPEIHMSVTLHLGFVFVVETEEHLSRLMAYEEAPRKPRVARSRIGRTTSYARPIDAVAGRVAPTQSGPDEPT